MVSTETTPTAPAWDDALLSDPHKVTDKRRRVRDMFAAIAPSYDLNNRIHSLWMDQRWRRKAVDIANVKSTDHVVDVACGTGDLTLCFVEAKAQAVIGIDFTYEMLPLACAKSAIRNPQSAIPFLNGDAQSLPLPDTSADIVSIAFGIRNVQDPLVAFKEFRRVLKPGGRLIVLEFSLPTNPVLRGLYNFYFKQILPRTATLISGDKTGAYKYLPQSVNTFISRQQMVDLMTEAGFSDVKQFPMTFGVCICYRGSVGSPQP